MVAVVQFVGSLMSPSSEGCGVYCAVSTQTGGRCVNDSCISDVYDAGSLRTSAEPSISPSDESLEIVCRALLHFRLIWRSWNSIAKVW